MPTMQRLLMQVVDYQRRRQTELGRLLSTLPMQDQVLVELLQIAPGYRPLDPLRLRRVTREGMELWRLI